MHLNYPTTQAVVVLRPSNRSNENKQIAFTNISHDRIKLLLKWDNMFPCFTIQAKFSLLAELGIHLGMLRNKFLFACELWFGRVK